jgi:hypothetical protein
MPTSVSTGFDALLPEPAAVLVRSHTHGINQVPSLAPANR